MGGAEAEVQAGGVALRRRQAARSTRPTTWCRPSRPSGATSSWSIRSRATPTPPRAISSPPISASCPATPRARTAIRPRRCGSCSRASPASTRSSTARAIDMAPGDVVLTPAWMLARPRQRDRRDQLLDRLPRHPVRAAQRGDVLRALSDRRPRADHVARTDADAHSLGRGARAGARRQDRRGRQGRHADDRDASHPPAQGRPHRDAARPRSTTSTRWSSGKARFTRGRLRRDARASAT